MKGGRSRGLTQEREGEWEASQGRYRSNGKMESWRRQLDIVAMNIMAS
jgi:hypothetical protein